MELCDFNLDKYIHSPNRLLLFSHLFEGERKFGPEFFGWWDSIREQRENVWTIMDHITAGVEFLHGRGLAHRDLKPQNGQSYPSLCIGLLY